MSDVKRLLDETDAFLYKLAGTDPEILMWIRELIVIRDSLPDYEAAVDALDEFVRWWDGEGIDLRDAEAAREALRRLREKVPA